MDFPFKLIKFIICTLILINSIFCYDPPLRYLHNSIIIGEKLFILEGYLNGDKHDLFYLDLSKPFSSSNSPWNLEGKLPVYTWGSTSILSLNQSTIYLYGGYMVNIGTSQLDYSNLVYTYDTRASAWSTAQLNGKALPRQDIKGVIDESGIIYIFGGFNATTSALTGYFYNDMQILNTVSNTWTTLSISLNLPFPRSKYTADLLPNGNIVYIGGLEQVTYNANSSLVDMNTIQIFNTKTYEWSKVTATGDVVVDPRMYHSSVLTPDESIIIFGGCTRNYSSVSPSLVVLDTSNFEWSIPPNSKLNSPPSIYGHTANLYFDYMIITFGSNTVINSFNSEVYFYNVKNDSWVTDFSSPKHKTSPSFKSSNTLEIALVIGILAAVLLLCCVFACFRRRYQLEVKT